MHRRRKILFSLLTVAVGIALIEGACAVVERTVLPLWHEIPSPAPLPDNQQVIIEVPEEAHLALVEDATKQWGLPPNQTQNINGELVHTDDMGMRTTSNGALTEGDVRLLTLGDSTIFGDGVDAHEVFSTIAAGHLSAHWGCTVKAFNGGVPGYNSGQTLTRLQELGPQVQPDYVVSGAIWSDIYFRDNVEQVEFGFLQSPLRRMATYRVLRTLLTPWLSSRKVRWIDRAEDIAESEDAANVNLKTYIDNLRRIAQLSAELGAETIFLVLPAPIDFDRAPVPETIQQYRAAMAHVARDTGSLLVDGPAWGHREGGNPGLFIDQVHPNRYGHALLGYALSESMRTQSPPQACREP